MGIPSYYRFLCQKNKSIIDSKYYVNGKTVLCLDFNCIVYYCLSKMGQYEEINHDTYEKELINEVCKYVEHIYVSAKKPQEVFIAVDGVVPMAKMKQQRLRRFKGLFMEPYEIEAGVRDPSKKSWDKNSITPGTVFMKKLNTALKEVCAKHTNWSLSGFDMPGEGEHKVMKYIRNYTSTDNTFLVYGLDADLILLSMLNSGKQNLYLMREEMEFNNVILDHSNKEQFLFLNIHKLNYELFGNPEEKYIQDYIMMMSLLGNDFVPHSLSLTIKDGGYNILFNLLKQFHKQNKFLVKDKQIQCNVLKEFIGNFYNEEPQLINNMCKKKSQIHSFKGKSEYEQKMGQTMSLPCKWYVEKEFYNNGLKQDWQNIYYAKFLHNDKKEIIDEYLKGLQWILDYYNGAEIEYDWYYPYMYTPLWKDIYDSISIDKERFSYDIQNALEPEQQLVLVLPIESYNLIQNPSYKTFPSRFPQYYPSKFGVDSLGKKWIYECESDIPIIESKFLRKILI
jgi:5'-3' exonuclease